MTHKKLGLLLCPLLPLTAIGIVEVASAILVPEPVTIVEVREDRDPVAPPEARRFARPRQLAPVPSLAPEPMESA